MFNSLFNEQLLIILIAGVSIVAILAIIMTIYLNRRMRKFEKAYISLQTFLSGTRLEDILKANLQEVRELSQKIAAQDSRLTLAEKKLRSGIDRAELVRFNSFDNMSGDLSFALALLNQEGTGVMLTGIHSIEESRVYAKTINQSQANVKLSKEEKMVLERASQGIKI
ncbi:MAG: DUF4446 family protein [Desulfitobacteriia bacterium]